MRNEKGFITLALMLTGWIVAGIIYTAGLFVWMAYDIASRACDAGFCGYGAGGSF